IRSMAETQKTFQDYQLKTNEIINNLANRNTRSPPAPLQDPFRGDSEGPTHIEYLSQIKTAFERYPDAFRNEKSKVNYAFASLKGPAAEFFAPIVAGQIPDTEGYLATFDSFAAILDTTFGNQLQVDEANHQLQRLRQHGMTITEYTTKFKTLVSRAGWEPKASLGRYKDGLSVTEMFISELSL
ncbi:Retrotransposon-derived protein peg10, partial [Gryganskiella cystojenkinii]